MCDYFTRPSLFGRGALNKGGVDHESSDDVQDQDNKLAIEETHEEFLIRRGLRKGEGGQEYMRELRDNGLVEYLLG